ncbi:MAG: hypothetical protein CMC08_10145 [Flavobacteriaceae bacterium]|nr:hypothetical protein [Flavobacteriaceae bacterium]|tara:strand:- start:199 stop:603 length:405 start_codon:yes stop_codon:yes gene_type:complete
MTIKEFFDELKNWSLTTYKVVNLAIGATALLSYELLGRPLYRPYIYRNGINDFHIADTLGNTLGTAATLFFLIGLLSRGTKKGNFLLILGTFSVVVFELLHPLLGKPIDIWDILATVLTGALSYLLYNALFRKE